MKMSIKWSDIITTDSLITMWTEITKSLPSILGALLILIIGWLVTKLIVRIIRKALKLVKANKLDDVLNDIEIFEGKTIKFDTIKFISSFIKWVMYIILIIMVSEKLKLTMISEQIGNLLGYLPKLFSALVIFTVGLILANMLKKGLRSFFESMNLSGAKIISQVVFFIILIFISITALNQAGVDTEIITSNITIILAAFLVAFALAFGLGAQKVVADLLKTFYARKTYEIGQRIEFEGIQGEVEAIDGISLTLKTTEGKVIIPIKNFVESQVRIHE